MNRRQLLKQIASGEDSTRQFKLDITNGDSLAAEMVALSNSHGGIVYIGVDDDGRAVGLSAKDVKRINQLVSNTASQHIRSPISPITENVTIGGDKVVIVLSVPEGMDKPYFDKNGIIWLKNGPDKRRVNSKEELRRIFQGTDQFHADELPTKAGIEKIDKLRFRDFLREVHKLEYPNSAKELTRLLQNMNLATELGKLNLAGVLLFAEKPELIKPQFVVKAIRFAGNIIHATNYEDTEDFEGALSKIFADSLAFIMRNLHKVQAGRGVNAPGTPEIPVGVFEELLVNALVHRDYLIDAAIRIFIFDNRIEIISPGCLPNNLTVEKIKTGNSNIRNPILVSYAAKGILPYHGIGSGISRALEEWPDIEFTDMRDGSQFIAIIKRKIKAQGGLESSHEIASGAEKNILSGQKRAQDDLLNDLIKSDADLLKAIQAEPDADYPTLGKRTGMSEATVKRHIQKLKAYGIVLRIGSRKTGHWKINDSGR